jgi:protein SCO1/2
MGRVVRWTQRVFLSWRFPTFALALLLVAGALVAAILVAPPSDSAFGAFAREFKVWCFNYDPGTRSVDWSAVASMGFEVFVLGAIVVFAWSRELGEVLSHPRRVGAATALAAAVVAISAIGFGATRVTRTRDLPFPGARIRTSFAMPSFTLVDQDGRQVRADDERGHVLLVTGVYAGCSSACPVILREAREAIAELAPSARRDVRVLAITLAPEHDDVNVLRAMARGHGVASPTFHLLGGAPADVNRLLDDLSIARTRDSATGVIDHANVFIVVDRQGRIAYRLSVGPQRRAWLVAALRSLAAE